MSQSIRVLIGDDSLELGISWATAFKEAGLYAITRPKMGKVLVDYVLTERPAVVILDAKTPGLDVCDIIRTLKGSGEYAPVIFVTANYDSAKVEFEVMDAGADYYMIRPFDPETLVSKVLSQDKRQTQYRIGRIRYGVRSDGDNTSDRHTCSYQRVSLSQNRNHAFG